MQWNFGEIVNYIEGLISPGGSSSSTARTNTIKDLVNSSFDDIALSFAIEELKAPDWFFQTVADVTTGTASVTEGSPTVTLTTAPTDEMYGRKFRASSDSDYYIIKDLSVASKTLTLDRNYLGDTDTAATYTIFENLYNLAYDTAWVKGVYIFEGDWKQLDVMDWGEIENLDPNLDDSGTPENYALAGERILREPTGTSVVTTTASTNSSQVACTSFLLDEDDYYNDWIWVNITRGKTSRVVDFTGATQIAALEEDIPGQTAGDTGYLLSKFNQISLYYRYTEIKNVKVKYYKKHPVLVNNYDIPLVPDEFRRLVAYDVLEKYYGNDPLAAKYSSLRTRQENFLKKRYSRKIFKQQKEGRRRPQGRLVSFRVQEQ